jgi:hypothetical protein
VGQVNGAKPQAALTHSGVVEAKRPKQAAGRETGCCCFIPTHPLHLIAGARGWHGPCCATANCSHLIATLRGGPQLDLPSRVIYTQTPARTLFTRFYFLGFSQSGRGNLHTVSFPAYPRCS